MSRPTSLAACLLALLAAHSKAHAQSDFTLAKDDPPIEQAWKKPATLAYTKNGDGTSNATIDAVLRYAPTFHDVPTAGNLGALHTDYSAGVYVHRDTSILAPKNDRGFQMSLGERWVADLPNDGPNLMLSLNGTLKFGKSLQIVTSEAGEKLQVDKTKERELIKIGAYSHLPKSGLPEKEGSPMTWSPDVFLDGALGIYSDRSSGNSAGNGRLSGTLIALTVGVAPFGLTPRSSGIEGLNFTPTVQLLAQTERDSHASGDRPKDRYTLYAATLTLAFAKQESGASAVVPSVNITRSTGADLLAGRAKSSKTEIALGLAF
jgi:hypothetical protein